MIQKHLGGYRRSISDPGTVGDSDGYSHSDIIKGSCPLVTERIALRTLHSVEPGYNAPRKVVPLLLGLLERSITYLFQGRVVMCLGASADFLCDCELLPTPSRISWRRQR